MLLRYGLSTCIAIVLMSEAAVAQPPGGPIRIAGGPGFGPGRQQGSFPGLLGLPEVRKELAVSEEQHRRIDAVIGELQEQMRTAFSSINFQELQELSPEEREEKLGAARKQSEEAGRKADEKLAKILSAKQLERLQQLRVQREGPAAFLRQEIASQLGLTAEQREKIQRIAEQRQGFFPPPSLEQRLKTLTDIVAILTPEQKAKLLALKGAEFKFPEPVFFGGGPMAQRRLIVKQFDKDGNGRLDMSERTAAREFIKKEQANNRNRGGFGFGPPGRGGPRGGIAPPPPGAGPGGGRPGGGFGPPGGFGRNQAPPKPGPKVAPADVQSHPDAGLYELGVLRTLFLEFEDKDWEAQMADFYRTDVEVPATLTVDGKKYPSVGVHFRGTSSYFAVGAGYKRSMDVSLDFADKKQKLYGYKTLNLLNSHEDPTYLHTVLYSHVARQYLPAPKANLVRVVINGESWGIYVNAQQFDRQLVAESFRSNKGARWKVPGNPGARGGLEYVSDKISDYKQRYTIKSADNEKDWKALINLCRVLNNTPLDKLEKALEPILDIDGVLWFLALDNVLINGDGYWTRASDYCMFLDKKGKFHIIPHDMNEAFQPAMMFGFGPGQRRGGPPGGPGGGPPAGPGGPGRPQGRPGAGPRLSGVDLDPLIGLNDTTKPLRSRLLAVPSLREIYLQHVRTIAEESLDWNKLKPLVEQLASLIEKDVEADTHKLSTYAAFTTTVKGTTSATTAPQRPGSFGLRAFCEQRRNFLLNHPEIKKLVASTPRRVAETGERRK